MTVLQGIYNSLVTDLMLCRYNIYVNHKESEVSEWIFLTYYQ